MSWYKDLTEPITIKPTAARVEAPAGFLETSKSKKAPTPKQTSQQVDALKIKKAWELATGPGKQIPMNLFMSYMSGNSLQLIPITMTLMLFTGPFKAILGVNANFQGLENEKTKQDIFLAKLTFMFLQLVVVVIGVYKLNSMGLIPNRKGDWLSWEVPTQYLESVMSV